MKIQKHELLTCGHAAGIPADRLESLWEGLHVLESQRPTGRFTASHLFYYVGILITIGATGWYVADSWDVLGGPGFTFIGLLFTSLFLLLGNALWHRPGLRIPAGLLLAAGVATVPLLIYGLERWTGFWPVNDPGSYRNFHPYINGSWILMEAITVVVGIVVLRFRRFAFVTAPIAFALWFLSMDLADFLIHGRCTERETITMVFGLVMLLGTYLVDLFYDSEDLSFWGYLFGVLAFWGGLTAQHSDSEVGKAIYCLINLVMIAASLLLRRKVFLVFGALGVNVYLYHLSHDVFRHALSFPIVLSVLGLGLVATGVFYQRREKQLNAAFFSAIPTSLHRWIPKRVMKENA